MSELAIPEAAPATLFRTEQPDEIVERATATANALAEVIRQKQVAVRIQGREYVRVEGWTLLGTMLGVFSCLRVDAQDRGRRDARSGRDVEGRRGNPVLMFSPWAIEADPRIALAESDRVFREHLELCGLGPDDDDPEFHKEPSGEQDE